MLIISLFSCVACSSLHVAKWLRAEAASPEHAEVGSNGAKKEGEEETAEDGEKKKKKRTGFRDRRVSFVEFHLF